MKKFFFTVLVTLCALISSPVFGQNQVFNKGNFNFSAGYGLVPTFLADGGTSNIPPLSARLGYSFSQHFNLSGYFGYSASTSKPTLYSDGIYSQFKNDFMMMGLRGELRSQRSEKFDIYGGFMLAYNHPIVKEVAVEGGSEIIREEGVPRGFNTPEGQLLYSGFVGGTYFVTKKIGVFAELGYGISMLNTGLSFKL